MDTWRFSLLTLTLLASFFPSAAHGCTIPGSYPDTPWSTHIESISPQFGIAGMTSIYIQGYCFGTTHGSNPTDAHVSVGGVRVPDQNITLWTDAEVVFTLPFSAVSGTLQITSDQYGSDDSLDEAPCCEGGCQEGWPPGAGQYCGNDAINATFIVKVPDPPLYNASVYPPSLVHGDQFTPKDYKNPPQYVTGTWLYSEGGIQDTIVLSQNSQNGDGSWSITGMEYPNDRPPGPITGTLDQYGDLMLALNGAGVCLEYLVLGSGDVTSQGYAAAIDGQCTPSKGFLDLFSNLEGTFWSEMAPPLFKSQSDTPVSETPTANSWAALNGSTYATYGAWERTFSPLSVSPGGSVAFASRSVYEQTGASGATDGCWMTGDPAQYVQQVTGVTGGGWYVYPDDTWYWDYIGMNSQSIDWYRNNQSSDIPCQYTVSQDMYIDGRTQVTMYTTNQLTFQIETRKVCSEVQPMGGATASECENYRTRK